MAEPLQVSVQAVSWKGGGAEGRPKASVVVEVPAEELEGAHARTIGWLKAQVEASLGVPVVGQRLFHSTHELSDSEMLAALKPSGPWQRRGSNNSGSSNTSTASPPPAPASAPIVELAMLSGEEHDAARSCAGLRLSPHAGLLGLDNLGNSCFMNTGLQCLSHIPALAAYFLNGQHKEELNTSNPLGHGGRVALAFAELQHELWIRGGARATPHRPTELRKVFHEALPHLFEEYDQQDVQEFLAFCLDALHEDLNRVRQRPAAVTPSQEKRDANLAARHGDEVAAAVAWMRYLERGKSFLVDLLQGQLRSSLVCKACGHRASNFDPFLYLSVPVSGSMYRVTDAIEKYLEDEVLQGEEKWFCERCKVKVEARKKIDLWKLPPVLVLHLKRFEFDPKTCQFRKLGNHLRMPEVVDLLAHTSSPQRDGARYEVVAVANHMGPFGFGHYTATCRVGGLWRRFDDDMVTELDRGAEVVGPDAYVVFLQRCQDGASRSNASIGLDLLTPRLLRRQTLSSPSAWPQMVSARNSLLVHILRRPSTETFHNSPRAAAGVGENVEAGEGGDGQPSAAEPPKHGGSSRSMLWPVCFTKACAFFRSFARGESSEGRRKYRGPPASRPRE